MSSKRHDSMAPKGVFDGRDPDDVIHATAASLIDHGDRRLDDTQVEISLEAGDDENADELCADDLIPSGSGDRISTQDAMRALIDARLSRTRPSDDFGTFELKTGPATSGSRASQPLHSLAPVEMNTTRAASPTASQSSATTPYLWLAVAAVALLAIGFYRRSGRPETVAPVVSAAQPTTDVPAQIVTAQPTPRAEADDVVAPELPPEQAFDAFLSSESEESILTLGTPTIVNIPKHETSAPVRPRKPSAEAATAKPSDGTAKLAPAPQKPSLPALPEAPSRDAIVKGFESVRAAVLECAHGTGGVAPIEATITGSGRITHATIGGYYQGTPEGSCIARALRAARFDAFSQDSIRVSFPYKL